jgi:RNase H-fold protein (predicted Holliday junction resolvase)
VTWRWWQKKQDTSITKAEQRNETAAAEEALEARETAELRFQETKKLDDEVSAVSNLLKRLRQENNFGALIEQSMRRRH